jgi:hypothetical protein
MNRDSSVGILNGRGSIPGRGKRFFSTPQSPDRLISNGYRGALSPGVKRHGREADHSPPSTVKVRNGGAITTLHHTSSWRGAY